MKRYLILLLAVLLLASPTPARAQEYTAAPVEISKEKVRLDGKIYYSHVVLEKQTLYSICKAYGVTLEDVFRSNPSLNLEKEGLKKDQIILIPIPEEEKAPEQSNTKVKRKLKVDDPEAEAAAKKAAQEKAARAAEEKAAKAEERATRAAEEKAKAEERAAAAAQAAEERAAKAAEEKAAKAAAQEKAAEEKAAAQAAADPGEVLTGDED
ncbi:MAG: LysM peptidoglycan-binding domain-containing protein, partial [Bacteroidales bacterium]|nr:LysM peptidoglycan-binding domain-containing protein [Bacteroidales bacterium]